MSGKSPDPDNLLAGFFAGRNGRKREHGFAPG
jgi:hypothetical protein